MNIKNIGLIFLAYSALTFASSNNNEIINTAQQLKREQKFEQALAHFEIARSLQPNNPQLTLECAYLNTMLENYDDALSMYQLLLKMFPNNPDLLCDSAFILRKQLKLHQAIEVYEKVLAPNHNNSKAQRGASHAYLTLGDFEKGWPAYEYRWVNPPGYNQQFKNYLENGGDLKNKIVLLKTEYGLGDTFHFIRYAQVLKHMGAQVIVECHKQSLVPLLSLCPYIDRIIPPAKNVPHSDFQALVMSMPLILNTILKIIPDEIPYLFADPTLEEYWKKQLASDTNVKIGICWQADTHTGSDNIIVKKDSQAKSIPVRYLEKLAELPHISLYSLQAVNGLDQLKNILDHSAIHQFGSDFDKSHGSFMDTAAVMKSLDLVITIDTSIAHLAGALGVPVWVLLACPADWRWMLTRNDTPWYPTMKLFRQPKPGDWHSVIEQVKHELSCTV